MNRSALRWGGVALVSIATAAAGLLVVVAAFTREQPDDGPRPTGGGSGVMANGAVAFLGGRSRGISTVLPPRPGWTQLTDPPRGSYDSFPAWSPDGSQLAFLRRGGEGPRYLVVAEADGTDQRPMAEGWDAEPPSWSPDGRRIAFTGYRGEQSSIVVVDAATGRATAVTDRGGGFLSWSPDGARLAFAGLGEGGEADVFTIRADGSDRRAVTEAGFDQHPVWSPRGDWIAYLSTHSGDTELYLVRPDGTGERRLTSFPTTDLGGYSPVWSPDGTRLALEASRGGGWDVYLVDAGGGGTTRLTHARGDEISPAWSPDGQWIAYEGSPYPSSEGNNAGTFDVYVGKADGSSHKRLTEGVGAGAGLSWQALPATPGKGRPGAGSGRRGDILPVPPSGETVPEVLADGHPVFVARHTDGTLSVVDAFSTHRPWGIGELVGWCPSSRTFDEPEHGARWNEYGQYLAGPASADLATYEVALADGGVEVGAPTVSATRSEHPGVRFQGPGCGNRGPELTLHRVASWPALGSPAGAVEAQPEGWIAVGGVLVVRAGQPALLCAAVRDGSCTSPATVEGIESEAWVVFIGRPRVTISSEWIARVEGDHLAGLTRTGLG